MHVGPPTEILFLLVQTRQKKYILTSLGSVLLAYEADKKIWFYRQRKALFCQKHILSTLLSKQKKIVSKVNWQNNACYTQENENFSVRNKFSCQYLTNSKIVHEPNQIDFDTNFKPYPFFESNSRASIYIYI